MHLSVIIVSWNTRELLACCLDSLLADWPGGRPDAPAGPPDIWVVDNGSSDGSAAMVRERFPALHLIANEKNLGFGPANNQAIACCRGEFILLLNPDTEVQPGALAELLAFMNSHPEAGAAGARLLNSDGSLQLSCFPRPSLARELWFLFHLDRLRPYGRYDMERWPLDMARPVDVLKGACLMVRRQALEQAGAFDESYFMYSEEVDLCTRLANGGWRLYWVPQAVVTHHEGQSTRQVPADMFLRLYQGKLLYFRKQQGTAAARLYKLILLAAASARLALSPLAWLERPAGRQRHLTLASHYRRLVGALLEM
jgi:GT2 family glycosyltransferase